MGSGRQVVLTELKATSMSVVVERCVDGMNCMLAETRDKPLFPHFAISEKETIGS
jgi:hypothetical protein